MDKLDLFEILIRQQSDMLRTFIRSVAFDKDLVDDVFQDTIVAAWEQIDSFDRSKPIGPWLRGIARNCLYTASRKRRKAIIDDEAVLSGIERQSAHIETLAGDTLGERTAALNDCLERLPSEQREAVHLCYFRDLPANRAAEVAHVSHEAMRKRLQRARADLLECLGGHGILEVPS
jgi:RNA polymerase sigma-70 factor (ECF subfamily)